MFILQKVKRFTFLKTVDSETHQDKEASPNSLSTNTKNLALQTNRVLIFMNKTGISGFHKKDYTAKSLQSCLTLCDPIDGSPSGSPVPGILQARTLEWVAISFSHAWKWKVKAKSLSRVQLLATAWTAAHQNPPSMGFSRQEYWSGVPLPSPKFLSTQGQISPCFQPQSSPTFLKRSHFPLF